jgi:hypothetical protein
MGKKRNVYTVLVRKAKGKRPLGRLDTAGTVWTGFIWLMIGSCEQCNEFSESVK